MTVEQIARGLDLRRVGSAWRGGCPLCGGSNRFQVRDGHAGPLVWCFGGCDRAAIITELQGRGLWPKSDRTPAERRDFARQRARDEADLDAARLFGDVAHILAEQMLEEMPPYSPERATYTRIVAALRTNTGTLAEYRVWRSADPKTTAALVRAGQMHRDRLALLTSSYLSEGVRHAA